LNETQPVWATARWLLCTQNFLSFLQNQKRSTRFLTQNILQPFLHSFLWIDSQPNTVSPLSLPIFTFRQVGVRPIEFQALPHLEAMALREKTDAARGRALKALEAAGAIRMEGHRIYVTDSRKLKKMA